MLSLSKTINISVTGKMTQDSLLSFLHAPSIKSIYPFSSIIQIEGVGTEANPSYHGGSDRVHPGQVRTGLTQTQILTFTLNGNLGPFNY